MSFVENFLKDHGIKYTVNRSGTSHTEIGLPNTIDGGKCICFYPDADIKPLDELINPAGDKYHVSGVETVFQKKSPAYLKIAYKTSAPTEWDKNEQTVFNIQNAYGSVIGNSNQATFNYNSTIQELKDRVAVDRSDDKEDLERIVSLLEMIVDNQIPPSKGLFSKFSAVMERHSWLSNSVAGTILSWLLTQSP